MKCYSSIFISKKCFVETLEDHAFSLGTRTLLSQIIDTKYHIL